MDPERPDIFAPSLAAGAAKRTSPSVHAFDLAPFVRIVLGDDLAACRLRVKEFFALYIGGMGARGKNFYNDYACRLGYVDEADKIQQLYLAGKKAEAIAAVPDRLVDTCSLVGPEARIRDQLKVWKAASNAGHLGTMVVTAETPQALRILAEELL